MDNKRIFYSAFIMMMTVLTVGSMLNMQVIIDSPETYNEPEDKIEYNEEKIEDKRIDVTNQYDESQVIKEETEAQREKVIETTSKRKTTSSSGKTPKYILFKQERISNNMERSFIDYDDETRAYLLAQLEEGIRRAKLDNFESLLNQDEVIETMSISEVEDRLSSSDKNELAHIIDRIGTTSNMKLMVMLTNGVTPNEQKEIYELLKGKLSDDEIVKLHDILRGYMKN